MQIIERHACLKRIQDGFRVHPIVSILGPRQCGKSTLARLYCRDLAHEYFDLEDPIDRRRLDTPMQALEPLRGLVVLDEIQRKPELFELLRVLADRPGQPSRFLILGSASPSIVRGVSETLAGRVGFIDLGGFSLAEIDVADWRKLWMRGGFPRSYLAADEADSYRWRESFVRTFLERDIPQLGITIPADTLRRFWTMMAHYHGQTWNAAELARSIGSSEPTARRYLDLLAGAYMVRVLPPWFENTGKRQVKAPRVYLRDSGMLHTLLELATPRDVERHPRLGASWEGFALGQALDCLGASNAYYWAAHGGAEVDLLLHAHGRRYGFEFKHTDAPGGTRSMHAALRELKLERLWVVYPGEKRYPISDRITAFPVALLPTLADSEPFV